MAALGLHWCAWTSHHGGFLPWNLGCRCMGSVVMAHGPSCPVACGIFPDQGSNPCPLSWLADSLLLSHQGNPLLVNSWYVFCYRGMGTNVSRAGSLSFSCFSHERLKKKACLKDRWASLVVQLLKNLPAMWKTWVWSLGWEDPLEKGTATHSRIPA